MAGSEMTHTPKLQIMQNQKNGLMSCHGPVARSCKIPFLIPTDHVWLFSWFTFACACFTVESNTTGASLRTAHNSPIAPRKIKSEPGRAGARSGAGAGAAPPPPVNPPFPLWIPRSRARPGTPPHPRSTPQAAVTPSEPSKHRNPRSSFNEPSRF
jgi:hypothetical protein